MSSQKGSLWKKIILVSLVLMPLLWLAIGKQGFINLYRTEMERQACIERIRRLAEENNALIQEIRRLQTDMKHLETIARREFNLIKKNEVIYIMDESEREKSGTRTDAPGKKTERDMAHGENKRLSLIHI